MNSMNSGYGELYVLYECPRNTNDVTSIFPVGLRESSRFFILLMIYEICECIVEK